MANNNTPSAIESLWREHCAAPFPEGMAGEEAAGICVVSLDTFTAGCIETFLSRGGKLDAQRVEVLRSCYRDLAIVVAEMKGEPRRYFARLEKLARAILQAVADGPDRSC